MDITINARHLDFSKLPLQRDEELAKLKAQYEAAAQGTAKCVLLEGPSGCGKTTFVEAFYEDINGRNSDNKILFCRSKFDEGSGGSEPYSAIVHALSQIVDAILQSSRREHYKIALQEALGDELQVLQVVVPRLEVLLQQNAKGSLRSSTTTEPASDNSFSKEESNNSNNHVETAKQDKWGFERLKFAVRTFLRTMATQNLDIIIFLDDVQWAAQDSHGLIQAIVEDTEPHNLLLICTQRPVPRKHAFNKLKQKLVSVGMMEMKLSELSRDNSALLLQQVFARQTVDELEELTTLVYQHTRGNIFFVIQFLQLVEQRGLVYFSSDDNHFEWKHAEVEKLALENTNVVDFIANQIQLGPDRMQVAVMTAASLGISAFAVDVVFYALTADEHHCILETIHETRKVLDQACEDGWLERRREGNEYTFVHDRVREAAYSLLPPGVERKRVHLRIGRQLRKLVDTLPECKRDRAFRNRLLLQAVSQMNLGAELITDEDERVELLVELNYQAAVVAIRHLSFYPASEFLERALTVLGGQAWVAHYESMLRITIGLARCRYCCGEFGSAIELADQIIWRSLTFADRKSAYNTKILSLHHQGKLKEAKKCCLHVVDELGVSMPKVFLPVRVIHEFLRTRKMIHRLSDKDLLSMKHVTDDKVNYQCEFLERYVDISVMHNASNPHLRAITLLKTIQLTAQHGLHNSSALTLACWGWILVEQGDFKKAYHLSQVALQLAKRGGPTSQNIRTALVHAAFVVHWQRPIWEASNICIPAIDDFWHHGFLEVYFMDSIGYFYQGFASGENLAVVETRIRRVANQLRDYRQSPFQLVYGPFFQLISNLTGSSTGRTELTGEYIAGGQQQFVAHAQASGDSKALNAYYMSRLFLAAIFGDHKLAYESSRRLKKDEFEGPMPTVPFRYLYAGLASCALFRITRRRKYRREALKCLRRLDDWSAKGAVNCSHMALLLQAEWMASSSKDPSMKQCSEAYALAITAAAENGIVQNEALANERAGHFLIFVCRERTEGINYLNQAIQLYAKWGAVSKEDMLRVSYSSWRVSDRAGESMLELSSHYSSEYAK